MSQVLVIDGDAEIRRDVRTMLAGAGHRVVEAKDGRTALKILSAILPEIVVVDIFVPEEDGLAVIRTLAGKDSGVAILAICDGANLSELDYLDFARKLGADETLAKPFSSAAFLTAVETALRHCHDRCNHDDNNRDTL